MAVHLITRVNISDGGSPSGRDTKKNLVYDPATGLWVPVTATTDKTTPKKPALPSHKTNPTPSTPETGEPSSNVDSETDAEKEYIEAEFNILTGEMRITPTTKSIRIRVNDTVKIVGLGKYLSGLYFVSAVSRVIDSSGGYSHSLTLIKNGFGDNVKTAPSEPEEETRKNEVEKEATEYKVGDKVKIVGEDAVYSNAHDGVKVPDWVKKKTHTIYQISDDKARVLLKEIWSWTYTKYIQKV